MGLIGILLAAWPTSSSSRRRSISWSASWGVLIFTGLTAYDTQKIKNTYYAVGGDTAVAGKAAIMGALALYLDFINLFLCSCCGSRAIAAKRKQLQIEKARQQCQVFISILHARLMSSDSVRYAIHLFLMYCALGAAAALDGAAQGRPWREKTSFLYGQRLQQLLSNIFSTMGQVPWPRFRITRPLRSRCTGPVWHAAWGASQCERAAFRPNAAENGKHRRFIQKIDGVIAPFAGGDSCGHRR